MKRAGAVWQVLTARGTVSAARVVLATNGYTDSLWPGLEQTIVPLFGAIAASAVLPEEIARGIMPSRAVLYESGAITVYYRVDSGQRLLIGGRGPMREVTATAAIAHLLAYARTLWPALAQTPWTHAWGGRLAMTPDQYLHVHEPADGVLICLGYNGRGVAMSTAMGAQIAGRLTNRSESFDMPITGLAPIALHACWPLAVRGAIALGRIRDFLGL
jgi:glycine/D-amino acid oxidase-like deaminating enzyme